MALPRLSPLLVSPSFVPCTGVEENGWRGHPLSRENVLPDVGRRDHRSHGHAVEGVQPEALEAFQQLPGNAWTHPRQQQLSADEEDYDGSTTSHEEDRASDPPSPVPASIRELFNFWGTPDFAASSWVESVREAIPCRSPSPSLRPLGNDEHRRGCLESSPDWTPMLDAQTAVDKFGGR